MFFEDSRPDRKKRARRTALQAGLTNIERRLAASPIPPVKPVEYLTPLDLQSGGDRTLIADVESYPNYWLCGFKCLASNKYLFFEDTPDGYAINGEPVDQDIWRSALGFCFYRHLIVGFNSRNYDMIVIAIALQGVRAWKLKDISDEIINGGLRAWEAERKYAAKTLNVNHIDIMEVAPLHDGLKTYAGRLHAPRMQDLPYQPDRFLTQEEALIVRGYNANDLDNTGLLYLELKPQIELREQLGREYNIDLRSKSDAQIAEALIESELRNLNVKISEPDIEPGFQFNYIVPEWVSFKTPQMQHALDVVRNARFTIGLSGHALLPKEVAGLKIDFDGCIYRMGNGGLHSSEKSVGYVATDEMLIIDRDVASYYPRIIINNGFAPTHLGQLEGSNESPYIVVYRDKLVDRRLKLKQEKNPLEAGLKIAINGTFGKNGNKYSKVLYAPQLVIQTTVSGQFGLMMQIEMVTAAGFKVVSANTDGIVILCPAHRTEDLAAVYAEWEHITGFQTEETRYKAIWSRDVNNYIAVKTEGGKASGRFFDERAGCKTKGVYSERGSALNSVLSKNPENLIVNDALCAFLATGKPVRETILECGDIRRFVSIKKATGGAEKDGVFLGKVIRWYYAIGETGAIHKVTSGNQVGKTEAAKPLMDLPDTLPNDLDYEWYIEEAIKQLYELGYYKKAHTPKLF